MEVCRIIIEAEENAVSQFNTRNFTSLKCNGDCTITMLHDKANSPEYSSLAKEEKFCGNINTGAHSPNVVNSAENSISNQSYSSLRATELSDNNKDGATPPVALAEGSKRHHVLTDMTPRPGVLRAVDKRGRTAADVAQICGCLFVATFLKSAELSEQGLASRVNARQCTQCSGGLLTAETGGSLSEEGGEKEDEEVGVDTDPSPMYDDVADDIAYSFAKTMYFDPSYDSLFKNHGEEEEEEEEEEEDGSDNDSST
jgi:hypothetical protein